MTTQQYPYRLSAVWYPKEYIGEVWGYSTGWHYWRIFKPEETPRHLGCGWAATASEA